MPAESTLPELPELFLVGDRHDVVHMKGGCTQSQRSALSRGVTEVTELDLKRFKWMGKCRPCTTKYMTGIFQVRAQLKHCFELIYEDPFMKDSDYTKLMRGLWERGYYLTKIPKTKVTEVLEKIDELQEADEMEK